MTQGPVPASRDANNDIPDADQVQKRIYMFDEIIKKQEERIRNLEIKAFTLAILFFVFQGVILSSISSSSSSLRCHHWWIPFLLSLLSAIVNVVSFWGTVIMYLDSSEQLDQNIQDRNVMAHSQVTQGQVFEAKPTLQARASSSQHGAERPGQQIPASQARASSSPDEAERPKADRLIIFRRRFFAYSSVALLVTFSGVVLYACRAIPCQRQDDNWVKHC